MEKICKISKKSGQESYNLSKKNRALVRGEL